MSFRRLVARHGRGGKVTKRRIARREAAVIGREIADEKRRLLWDYREDRAQARLQGLEPMPGKMDAETEGLVRQVPNPRVRRQAKSEWRRAEKRKAASA